MPPLLLIYRETSFGKVLFADDQWNTDILSEMCSLCVCLTTQAIGHMRRN